MATSDRPLILLPHEAVAGDALRVVVRPVKYDREQTSDRIDGWCTNERHGDTLDRWHPFADAGMCNGMVAPVGPAVVCPLGAVGDGLWGRTPWLLSSSGLDAWDEWSKVCRNGDGDEMPWNFTTEVLLRNLWRRRRAREMPRWASRWHRTITSIRVCRASDITEAEARGWGWCPALGIAGFCPEWNDALHDLGCVTQFCAERWPDVRWFWVVEVSDA